MSDDELESLRSGDTGAVLRAVADSPYIREDDLREATGLDEAALDAALERLTDADLLVGLTRQSGSSLESRVPDRVFLLNPDRADEFDPDEPTA